MKRAAKDLAEDGDVEPRARAKRLWKGVVVMEESVLSGKDMALKRVQLPSRLKKRGIAFHQSKHNFFHYHNINSAYYLPFRDRRPCPFGHTII